MAIQLVIEESPVCVVRFVQTNRTFHLQSRFLWGLKVDKRKYESPTGDQLSIFDRQHSIFGRIGDCIGRSFEPWTTVRWTMFPGSLVFPTNPGNKVAVGCSGCYN